MTVEITDDMVNAAIRADQLRPTFNRHDCMRAALAAVAPMIEAQVVASIVPALNERIAAVRPPPVPATKPETPL